MLLEMYQQQLCTTQEDVALDDCAVGYKNVECTIQEVRSHEILLNIVVFQIAFVLLTCEYLRGMRLDSPNHGNGVTLSGKGELKNHILPGSLNLL